MVDRWREAVIANPNHWWDISRHQMVRDLPESERQGSVNEHPVVHIDKRPWEEIPPRIQEALRAVYDAASHDAIKTVSVIANPNLISFKLHSPSVQGGIFPKDLYGENYVSNLRLQLVDDNHPSMQGHTDPKRVPAGFWEFKKWPIAREDKEREIHRRREEDDIEPSIEERLMLNIPKTRIAMATMEELEDLAEFLETQTPNTIVWYVDNRFVPQIANPPWFNKPTHVLSTDDEGQLQIKPIDESQEEAALFDRTEPTPEAKEYLRLLSVEALKELISDRDYSSSWERFRFTYEARSQFRWLEEFGYEGEKKPARGKQPRPVGNPIKGMAGALKELFHFYDQELNEELVERNERDGMFKEVDDSFMQNLYQAAELIAQEPVDDRGFIGELAWRLEHRKVDIANISLEELKRGLMNGISKYWEQTYAHGYSGEPW